LATRAVVRAKVGGGTCGLQAATRWDSVSKRNGAGLPRRAKAEVELNTCPVGCAGVVTVSRTFDTGSEPLAPV